MKRESYLFFFRVLPGALLLGVLSAIPLCAADSASRDSAGFEESRFKKEQEFKEESRLLEERKDAEVSDSSATPGAQADAGPKFVIREIKFLGNYSIRSEKLQPLFAKYLNQEVTLAQMQEAVRELKEFYRSKGFIAIYAYIPAQDIDNGILKVDIMEGRLSEIKVSETKWFSSGKIRRMLRMKEGDILTYGNLRRDLARLNEYRDIKASASLEAGKQTGTSDVLLAIEERSPFHLSGEVNNQGSKNTGKYQYGVTAAHTNLTGHFDELASSAQFSRGTSAIGIAYDIPISDHLGTKLGYSYTYAEVDVGGDFAILEAEGDAQTHSVSLIQPVLETEPLEAKAKLGLDIKTAENRLLGQVSGRDDLSILNMGIDLKETDANGLTVSPHSLHFGFSNFLGASDKTDAQASRLGTGGQLIVYRGGLTRFQKLSEISLASLRSSWQFTPDALAPSEQFAIGGAYSVRGYQESEYVGDYGGYLSLDSYWQAFFLPETWKVPGASENLQKQLQVTLFADVGGAGLKKPLSGEKKHRTLGGAGLGLRIHLFDKFYGRCEWAFPLGDRPSDSRNSAVHFTVSYELF